MFWRFLQSRCVRLRSVLRLSEAGPNHRHCAADIGPPLTARSRYHLSIFGSTLATRLAIAFGVSCRDIGRHLLNGTTAKNKKTNIKETSQLERDLLTLNGVSVESRILL